MDTPIIQEIEVKSVLSKSNLPVCEYSVNPYVGCPHACQYCYASFMKRFTNHPEPWGDFLDVKCWPNIKNPQKYAGKELFIGSVTDPYNPQEEIYGRTRALLTQLQGSGAKISIATKADLILRDLELIKSFPNARVGLEPFDAGLTADYLQQHFGKRKKAVKECLLDQSVIAGIGNIYSDEILFAAKIHPARPANSLTKTEWKRLTDAVPERLAYFIEKNALTQAEYLESKGQDYRNTPFLQVYGRGEEPCPSCGAILCRITVGGRSSVFCPICQQDGE